MPGVSLPPDPETIVGGGLVRTERMERQTRPTAPRDPEVIVFSYPGALATNVESPPWYPFHIGAIRTIRISLLTAATANHVIEVRVDGAAIQQFTLTTGLKTISQLANIAVNAGSYVSVKTITVSDADMTITMALA